jgi:hypothetical protein
MKSCFLSSMMLVLLTGFLPLSAVAIQVSSVAELENAVAQANSGGDKNIVIQSGTYHLNGVYLHLAADNITVSGATGSREDVVLDGDYVTTEIFQVVGSSITIKDLTLQRAVYHPIHVFPGNKDVTGTVIDNVHIIDPGQQAIKINQNAAKTYSANSGTVKRSRIELTDSGRNKVWQINGSCYTGGVDGHHATDWKIVGNEIEGFWCEDGLSEHGVHFWSFSTNTLVEGNAIINCDRGVGFGLGSSGHVGGTIRNNMIYHDSGHSHSDVGIGLESASDALVYNNTIFLQQSYPNAIEYRFSATSNARIINNLTNKAIISRQGGSGSLSANITSAQLNWFAEATAGNLHLAYPVTEVIDQGSSIAGLTDDFDGESRPAGDGIDVGADEYSVGKTGTSTISSWLQLLLW